MFSTDSGPLEKVGRAWRRLFRDSYVKDPVVGLTLLMAISSLAMGTFGSIVLLQVSRQDTQQRESDRIADDGSDTADASLWHEAIKELDKRQQEALRRAMIGSGVGMDGLPSLVLERPIPSDENPGQPNNSKGKYEEGGKSDNSGHPQRSGPVPPDPIPSIIMLDTPKLLRSIADRVAVITDKLYAVSERIERMEADFRRLQDSKR